jgi:threonine dehydrogenase-like Zn-dependent dehydrogenase
MESLCIYFTGKDRVELVGESVPPVGPGQVLVRARKSLISTGTECICLGRLFEEGTHWDRWVKYPFPPGYSMMGVVEELGEGVSNLQPGDRVVFQRSHRQWHVVDASLPVKVPDDVSDEDASWFALAMISQNAVRAAEHQMGDNVVVIGAGLLGQLTVQYLRLMGARQIIVVDPSEPRLKMAKEHGATTVIAKKVQDAREEILALTDGRGSRSGLRYYRHRVGIRASADSAAAVWKADPAGRHGRALTAVPERRRGYQGLAYHRHARHQPAGREHRPCTLDAGGDVQAVLYLRRQGAICG